MRTWKFHDLGEKLSEMCFDAMYSIIRDTNAASQKVALRNGMRPIDTIIKHYRGVDMPHIVFRANNAGSRVKAD